MRATVPFAAGALTLGCFDQQFHQGAGKRKHAATRDLINLQLAGGGAVTLGRFLTRLRLLSQQAGEGVGDYARIEILQRAATRHPRLAMTWAAWKQVDGQDVDGLLAKMEEVAAEWVSKPLTAKDSEGAWAALDEGAASLAVPQASPTTCHGGSSHHVMSAHVAESERARGPGTGRGPERQGAGPKCYKCGRAGHLKRDSQERRGGREDVTNADLARKMDELVNVMMGAHGGQGATKSKNE